MDSMYFQIPRSNSVLSCYVYFIVNYPIYVQSFWKTLWTPMLLKIVLVKTIVNNATFLIDNKWQQRLKDLNNVSSMYKKFFFQFERFDFKKFLLGDYYVI